MVTNSKDTKQVKAETKPNKRVLTNDTMKKHLRLFVNSHSKLLKRLRDV